MNTSEKEDEFKKQVYSMPYEGDILEEFFLYWSEPDKKGKMRWEFQKTWDLGRRLKRWERVRYSRPDFTKNQIVQTCKPLEKPPENDLERLQVLFTLYTLKPTSVEFELFGQFFELMKLENLLKELSEEEKQVLKNVYGNNGFKLRCAWVIKTFDWYYLKGKDFKQKKITHLKAV